MYNTQIKVPKVTELGTIKNEEDQTLGSSLGVEGDELNSSKMIATECHVPSFHILGRDFTQRGYREFNSPIAKRSTRNTEEGRKGSERLGLRITIRIRLSSPSG